MSFTPFIAAFFMIAVAELGDKTQLLTMGFATRYPIRIVIPAVALATALLMGLAVIFGGAINAYIPQFYLGLAAGIVFIGFGLWTIFGKEEDEEKIEAKHNQSPFWVIFSSFFLAELGDKTQLATLTLSAQYGSPILVWLGATLGMVAVNIVAAVFGKWMKHIIPEKALKWTGAILFIGFGVATLIGLLIK
ncbi:MAG: TMEM165/GDT1 family protein [Candidatus Saganbacteria bacterium]|nr:TMEM165/GDT1 family protein [Candidatus Saganbacteria bacterium]